MKICQTKQEIFFSNYIFLAVIWAAILAPHLLLAQGKLPSSNRIIVGGGLARSGTGDRYGLFFGVGYEHQLNKKFAWAVEIGSTIHDGSDPMFVTTETGETLDLSSRYTTAGMQLAGSMAYQIVRLKKFGLAVQLGPLVRYQSSSLADERIIYFPILTQYPLPLTVTIHREPQRTLAVGALSRVFVDYHFSKTMFTRFSSGLQIDTNGDTMFPQVMLSIGRKF